jgi:hypothetical protein
MKEYMAAISALTLLEMCVKGAEGEEKKFRSTGRAAAASVTTIKWRMEEVICTW